MLSLVRDNPTLCMLCLAWLCSAVIAIARDSAALWFPFILTILWGIYKFTILCARGF